MLLSKRERKRREALAYNRQLAVKKNDLIGYRKWTGMIYESVSSRFFKIPWSLGCQIYYLLRIPIYCGLFGFDCWFFYHFWQRIVQETFPDSDYNTSLALIPWGICVVGWAISYIRTIANGSPLTFRNFARSYGWIKAVDLGTFWGPDNDHQNWFQHLYRGIKRRSRMLITHLLLYGFVFWYAPSHSDLFVIADDYWSGVVVCVILWSILAAFIQFPRTTVEFAEGAAKMYVASRVWKAINNLADMDVHKRDHL